jgi:hypothetical protein
VKRETTGDAQVPTPLCVYPDVRPLRLAFLAVLVAVVVVLLAGSCSAAAG